MDITSWPSKHKEHHSKVERVPFKWNRHNTIRTSTGEMTLYQAVRAPFAKKWY